MFTRSDGRVILGACALLLVGLGFRLWVVAPPVPPALEAAHPELRRVDLNRASFEELLALPGVGPVLAERIVRDRLHNGPFRSVEELLRVPGIGPKLLERIRPYVEICRKTSAAEC